MTVAAPTTLDAALEALDREPATVLAGGTDLMVEVNDGRRAPADVVTLSRVPELRGWRVDGNAVVIGAATTYTDLLASDLASRLPALAAAARTVGSPQIRNAGTIGGNLATASPAGDTLPVLVALDASVEIASRSGTRTSLVRELFVGPKRTTIAANELIVTVRVPVWRGPQDYLKVGARNAMVIAVAALAFAVDLDARKVGVGLGSVGPTPLTADDVTDWLAGRLTWRADGVALSNDGDLEEFGRLVAEAARPIDDHRATAVYRRYAVAVLARRALRRALGASA